jgi:hypothetical protein
VYAGLKGSGVQQISGPLLDAKLTFLIFPDWLSLEMRRSSEISDLHSTEKVLSDFEF